MPSPTSEDDLKRRARRRLIGAVALTLAAVIVLPLLLEDEPPPANHLEVHMPPVVELPKANDAPVAAATPPIAANSEPGKPIMPAPPAAEVAALDKPDPEPVSPPATEPKNRPVPNAAEKSVSKPELADKPKPRPVERVKPDPVDAPKAIANKPAVSAFVVQLGAFSHADKAVELKSRVESLGLGSYTDRSGALTRLRVGPFSSREAAEEAAARLSENGVSGKVMPK